MRAAVFGATGATGRQLVHQLAENKEVEYVAPIVRRPLSEKNVQSLFQLKDDQLKKVKPFLVDYEDLEASREEFEKQNFTAAFCALGSTRAKAGSAENFRHIDYGYTMAIARLIKPKPQAEEKEAQGTIKHFSLVSSTGANKDSWFLYPKTKGEIEADLEKEFFGDREHTHWSSDQTQPTEQPKTPFRYSIFRPGLLITERINDSRFFERIAQSVWPALHWIVGEKHKAVETKTVAATMISNALKEKIADVELFENDAIRRGR